MGDIELYTFEDSDGQETGFTTTDAAEARSYASENGLRWIANIYVFSDSETVEDFTAPKGEEQP